MLLINNIIILTARIWHQAIVICCPSLLHICFLNCKCNSITFLLIWFILINQNTISCWSNVLFCLNRLLYKFFCSIWWIRNCLFLFIWLCLNLILLFVICCYLRFLKHILIFCPQPLNIIFFITLTPIFAPAPHMCPLSCWTKYWWNISFWTFLVFM